MWKSAGFAWCWHVCTRYAAIRYLNLRDDLVLRPIRKLASCKLQYSHDYDTTVGQDCRHERHV